MEDDRNRLLRVNEWETVLYGRRNMSLHLKKMLPKPYTIRRTTRSSLSTGKHALTVPVSRTHATGKTFIHTAVDIWNSLPDNVVGRITDNKLQSFKTRSSKALIIILLFPALTFNRLTGHMRSHVLFLLRNHKAIRKLIQSSGRMNCPSLSHLRPGFDVESRLWGNSSILRRDVRKMRDNQGSPDGRAAQRNYFKARP
ncbi:hypothetical protein Bbelb_107700 [Branchiostoma belcheri]|nr:hypothetical protein Bbelb_107700 [Branchiostoma belcheri]